MADPEMHIVDSTPRECPELSDSKSALQAVENSGIRGSSAPPSDGCCFATPYIYYGYIKNYVESKNGTCYIEKQLYPAENGRVIFNYAYRESGEIVKRFNAEYYLESGPGYNVSNVEVWPTPSGEYSSFPVLYLKCGSCIIYKPVRVADNACSMTVVDPNNIDPCCMEMYDYLCGPTRVPVYDKCACADVYAVIL
ncbi:uncharacterized protein LOC135384347 [Ornithodoros turicata]|uniref:uncharacterized protein LOC135384347 n=1 Tax=Ornithodoros turicata TaxID=34597 RepID=UPI003138AAD7